MYIIRFISCVRRAVLAPVYNLCILCVCDGQSMDVMCVEG